MRSILFIILLISSEAIYSQKNFTWSHGGIIRGDTHTKKIALVFSADEYGDGAEFIISTLEKEQIQASFFFTGKFLKNDRYAQVTRRLIKNGNYVGSHSYGHILYCDWNKRDSTLVTEQEFMQDLNQSFALIRKFGIEKYSARFFLPPYEWYNDTISKWSTSYGLQLINFTPGTYSNADYTTPDMGLRYLDSDTIYNRIIRFERQQQNGLNGFILLIHAGTAPTRTDKFYYKLPQLIIQLKSEGYLFVRIDELL